MPRRLMRVQAPVAPAPEAIFPLAVHASGRYLVNAQGDPFLMVGDTAWYMDTMLTDAEIVTYLDDRQARGFNTVLVNLLNNFAGVLAPPQNRNGIQPFTTTNDFTAPNDAFYADWIARIAQPAAARGIMLVVVVMYLGAEGLDEWWPVMSTKTTTVMQNYGAYLAGKFAAVPNIMWSLGGDWYDPAVDTRTEALQAGLATGAPDRLFTYHGEPLLSSRACFPSASWLDVDWVYAYTNHVAELANSYAATPAKPMAMMEAEYEDGTHAPSDVQLRWIAWQSLLRGGMGHIFGNDTIYGFNLYGGTAWTLLLGDNGSVNMTRYGAFFAGLEWWKLVPDLTQTVLTAGWSSGTDAAACAVASDDSFAVAYVPSSRAMTLDMTEFSGPNVLCRWFNPFTGAYTAIGTYANTGSQVFTPGAGDWALLMQSTT
jgi:hypothetical protein